MAKIKRKRSVSVSELLNTNFKTMAFDGEMQELFGCPEMSGCWIVWGESFNGKTSGVLQLCKYLTKFAKVAYDSIEEGNSESLKRACIRENMIECDRRFQLLDKEPIEELEVRLTKQKAPGIVVIDTIQYSDLNKKTAKELVDRHPTKLFIFISHSEGKNPEGRTAMSVKRLSNVKIRVEGYRMTVESRYGGNKEQFYTIWHEGAQRYYGEIE
jgi:hypothetical protein